MALRCELLAVRCGMVKTREHATIRFGRKVGTYAEPPQRAGCGQLESWHRFPHDKDIARFESQLLPRHQSLDRFRRIGGRRNPRRTRVGSMHPFRSLVTATFHAKKEFKLEANRQVDRKIWRVPKPLTFVNAVP